MSTYKLTYFDVRALAEPIRFIFAMNNVPFEDRRVTWEEWAEDLGNLKSEIGHGQLPVLEFDGKTLTQSMAIIRYLARTFDLVPDDSFLAARCDEIGDLVTELRLEFRPFVMTQDEKEKAEIKARLNETAFPKYYKIFNKLVGQTKGPFIAGDKLSWADLVLANWIEIWEDLVVSPEYVKAFPSLQVLREQVFGLPALSKYFGSRKKTWV